jgi:hypothetical protein
MKDKFATKRYFLFLCVVGIFTFASCSPPPTPPSAPSSPTSPATVIPTRKKVTVTSTPDFYATAVLATRTAIAEAVIEAEEPRVHGNYPSPDDKWQAKVIIYDCVKVDDRPDADTNAYEQLKLVQADTGEEKIIDSQLQYCGGLGAGGFEGLFWSPNGRFFYYTDAREGVPDGCGFWERPIMRLDINSLNIEYLGGGPVSPDGTKIATWQENEIIVWDLNEGIEVERILPYVLNTETGMGPILWSPDSHSLVYIQPESYCPISGNSYVVQFDLFNLEHKILLQSDSPTFGGASWDTLDKLRLFDENGKLWIYDFGSQDLKPLP